MAGRAGGSAAALLALTVAAACQEVRTDWAGDHGFSLRVPSGWSVVREIAGEGLSLSTPDHSRTVEIVVWTTSIGVITPDDVAAEHDRVLGRLAAYARLASRELDTPAGPGLYVTGQARLDDGSQADAAYVAFREGELGVVVGTFVPPGALADVREATLDPVLDGLSFGAPRPAPGPAVDPAEPEPEPEPDVEPEPAVAEAPEPAAAEPPPAPVIDETAWQTYTHPCGVTLETPPSMGCSVGGRVIRGTEGAFRVYLMPVSGSGALVGDGPRSLVRGVLAADTELGPAECRPCTVGGDYAWVWVTTSVAGRPATGIFAIDSTRPDGMAAGIVSTEPGVLSLGGVVARMLGSLDARIQPAPSPDEEPPGAPWLGETGVLECLAPVGWRLSGGAAPFDEMATVQVRGRRNDGRAWFLWSQPVKPLFRELTDAMQRLGFRDGDPYYAYDGDDARMVMSRGGAADLVERFLLPQDMLPPGSEPVGKPEELEGVRLLGYRGERAEMVELRSTEPGEPRPAWCIISQATVDGSRGGWFWEAACLAYGGDEGSVGDAREALRQVVLSAHRTEDPMARLDDLVARAASAVDSVLADEREDEPWAPSLVDDGLAGQPFSPAEAFVAAWAALGDGTVRPYVGDANQPAQGY